jgi:hypothetical protein
MSCIFVSFDTQLLVDIVTLIVVFITGIVMAFTIFLILVSTRLFPKHWTSGTTALFTCLLIIVIFLSFIAITLIVALSWKYIVGTSFAFYFYKFRRLLGYYPYRDGRPSNWEAIVSKQVFGWWWMDISIVARNIVSLSGLHASAILLVFTPADCSAVVYACVIVVFFGQCTVLTFTPTVNTISFSLAISWFGHFYVI